METGFRIIDFLLKRGKPVPMREIATATDLTPNKLQFCLISLVEVRIVRQDRKTGHHRLGPYSLQLGTAGLQQFDIFQSAHPRLDAFAESYGHSVFMGVWGNLGPTIFGPIFDYRKKIIAGVL